MDPATRFLESYDVTAIPDNDDDRQWLRLHVEQAMFFVERGMVHDGEIRERTPCPCCMQINYN